MAIAEMKKLTLLALKKDKPRLLKTMQRMGCVQVLEKGEEDQSCPDPRSAQRLEEIQGTISRLDGVIARLNPFDKHKAGLLSLRPQAGSDQIAMAEAGRAQTMEVVARVEQIERNINELRARENRERSQIEQLQPWEALQIPLEKLGETKTALIWLAQVPQKNMPAMKEGLSALGPVTMEELGQGRNGVNALLAAHLSVRGELEELMRSTGSVRVQFEDVQGTPALALDQLYSKLMRIDEVRQQLREEILKLADHLPELRLLRDVEAAERDRLEAGQRCVDTQAAFLLTGWVRADSIQRLEKALKRVSPVCQMEFEDPAEGEQPPTYLCNKAAISPFESIVKMFSIPNPQGIDPTFVMMPFWVCFFGMMVSDAGYGVVLALAASFVWWKLKGQGLGRMAFVLALGGLSTVVWGAVYGGWFGVTPYTPLLDPMNDAINVLIVCVVAGSVHLLAGLGVAAYMNIKRGKPLDALFDQGFWVMLLAGLGLIIFLPSVGQVLAIVGAAGIVLTGGRGKEGNVFKKLIGGLGSLYGISGYLSDLLSYARLFGMGLATGVIGMVVNMLAGLLMGSWIGWIFAILFLVVMHTFNLFINTLGAYVHSCRLQYIEFFGKFFEGGGREFNPLRNNTKYVDLTEGES